MYGALLRSNFRMIVRRVAADVIEGVLVTDASSKTILDLFSPLSRWFVSFSLPFRSETVEEPGFSLVFELIFLPTMVYYNDKQLFGSLAAMRFN